MSLKNSVDSILDTMHRQSIASNKGSYGEKAVLSICEDFYKRRGGILIHSYSYKTVPSLAGNIKRQGNSFYVERTGSLTEIDILLVTKFRIYPIEVKAYRADTITLTNDRITGCKSTGKSPEHQNEMHCRHLYPHLYSVIPDGITQYIVPIVVFVDATKVYDNRSDDHKAYCRITILNQLRQLLEQCDRPLNHKLLDIPAIELKLKQAMLSNEKFLPYVK